MSRPDWNVEGRDWPNRAASRFVEAGRLRWHVQVAGEGPVVVLLHGTGAATHSWRDLLPLLAERCTVIAPDLPGHGFTTGRPAGGLGMTAIARATGELLTTLGQTPAAIVGHSAGAAIGLRMILNGRAAPATMVGLSPALLPFPGLAATLFPTLARLLFVNPFAPHIFAAMARGPGEAGRFLARSTGSHIDAAGVDFYRRLFATSDHCAGAITMMADWDLASLARDLPNVRARTLLVHGDKDAAIPLASVREAAALIPGATLENPAGTRASRARGATGRGRRADHRRDRGGWMMHGWFALMDMAIVGVPVLIFSVWQLVSVNREIGRDRAANGSPDSARHPVGEHREDDG